MRSAHLARSLGTEGVSVASGSGLESARPTSGTPIDWWAYSYDSDDEQVASEAELANDNTILQYGYYPDGRVSQYELENNDTLEGETPSVGTWTSIGYDNDGNRTSWTPPGASGPTTYSYNANDSLNQTTSPSGSPTDSYDTDGRLQSDGCTTYQYDGMDHVYQATTASSLSGACGSLQANQTTTTMYDALGRPVVQEDADGFSEQHYVSTGSEVGLIQKGQAGSGGAIGSSEDDLALLLEADGTPSQATGLEGAGSEWYTNDGLGNVGAVTGSGAEGGATCVLKYDIYGSPLQPTSAQNPCVARAGTAVEMTELGYQFVQRDPTTGDYTLGARTYDPSKAAFTTPDGYHPITTASAVSIGADPLTADTYVYANADPVNFRDPTGHMLACDNGGGCGTIVDYTKTNGGSGGPVNQAAVASAVAQQRTDNQNQDFYDANQGRVQSVVASLDQADTYQQYRVATAQLQTVFQGQSSDQEAYMVGDAQYAYSQQQTAYQAQLADETQAASSCSGFCPGQWAGAAGGGIAGGWSTAVSWYNSIASRGGNPLLGPNVPTPVQELENTALIGVQLVPGLDGVVDGAEAADLAAGATEATSEGLSFTDTQLQSQLAQHGTDFGLQGVNNAAGRLDYMSSLVDHVDTPGTAMIEGTYRGAAAIHYLNPETGLNVFTTPEGGFWGAWQLSPAQIENVVLRGSLR